MTIGNSSSHSIRPGEEKPFGIFFDKDGTLDDSEPAHWQATRDTLQPYGVALSWDEWNANAIGHSDEEIITLYAGNAPHATPPVEALLKVKRARYTSIVHANQTTPDANVALLHELQGHRIALVTSSTRSEIRAAFRKTQLENAFGAIVCLDDVVNPKPHPEPYLIAKQRLGVTRGVAFEDSTSGCASAQAAGLDVVRVPSPAALPELVRKYLRANGVYEGKR